MREARIPIETVPGGDLGRLREDLPPDCLEAGIQRVEDRLEMPLAPDARTIFLGILCLIAVLACLYIAQDIVLPVVLALVLKLLLQPVRTTPDVAAVAAEVRLYSGPGRARAAHARPDGSPARQPIITAIQPYRHGDGGPRRHGYPSRTPT